MLLTMPWSHMIGCVFLTTLVAGCASQVPREIREAPAGSPSEAAVRVEPDKYVGTRVRWGGKILKVENRPNESWIEIVSYPLESSGRPDEERASGGRFLARNTGFLDPAVLATGQAITVTGTLESGVSRLIGEFSYKFPVVKIEAYYLWPVLPPPSYPPPFWWYDPWWPYPHHRYPYWP